MSGTVSIRTYGCQMNEADSEAMAGLLEGEGWAVTDDEAAADVVLLNTCCVRRHAEERVWNALFALRARAAEGGLIVGVCGCMAQWRGEEIVRRAPHVRVVCGTRAFARLPDLIRRAAAGGAVVDVGEGGLPAGPLPRTRRGALKALVPVMRGCGNFCAYCVVPYVRGPEESRPPGEIAAAVEALARDGCREVTLLGQNVNGYAAAGVPFAGLLRIVGGTGIARIRFLTSHPKDLSDGLIRAIAEVPQVCEHLHLPLQAGSDRVLERMRRGCAYGRYRALVVRIRAAVPGIAISTDLMAGFPGETADDFERTLGAMEELRFDAAFLFKYSDREGTTAAAMGPKVPPAEIAERHARMLDLQSRIGLERNRERIGGTEEVLVEGPSARDPRRLFGRSRTNRRVVFEGDGALIGTLACATIRDATPLTLIGAPRAA
ncbi:MAG: tRNA (N6-isopentenyl adenosine(37)-C2)-methylthiotransferase MiaB [bacterium]|nr:tRNA (N6-isopentenyl adenosine(37)-C2)-methylthiotransferase MiaB [bacterium]